MSCYHPRWSSGAPANVESSGTGSASVFLTAARPPIIVSPNSIALYEGRAFIVIEQVFYQERKLSS